MNEEILFYLRKYHNSFRFICVMLGIIVLLLL